LQAAMKVQQIPKPSRTGGREILARRVVTSQSEYFTQKHITKRPGLEEKTYCQKFSNLTTQAIHSDKQDKTGHKLTYYSSGNSK